MDIVATYLPEKSRFVSAANLFRLASDGSQSGQYLTCICLWDTGAPYSLVSDKVARTIALWELNPYSAASGIGGVVPSSDFAATLVMKARGGEIWMQNFLFASFPARNLPGIDVVIGMDIMEKGSLVIRKIEGKMTLIFTPDG